MLIGNILSTQKHEKKDTLSFWRERIYEQVQINRLTGRNILDVGCGSGVVSRFLATIGKFVTAFDIQEFLEWKTKRPKNLTFAIANAEKMPYEGKKFSGIFLQDVLHHVRYPEKVLKEIDRVTKKGSVIIIVEGNRYNPMFYIHMTKMRGHEHLTHTTFQRIIKTRFKKVTFFQFESHYIPYINYPLYICIEACIEKIFTITPLLNRFKSYNLAIIEK